MTHALAKTLIIVRVSELIAKKYKISLKEARNLLYSSHTIQLIHDDETGLYGESALYSFSLFEQEQKKQDGAND